MKKFLLLSMAALALLFAGCDKEGGSSDSSDIVSVKIAMMDSNVMHFGAEYTPTFDSDGFPVKVGVKVWMSTTWTPEGIPSGVILSNDFTTTISLDKSKKVATFKSSGKTYNEDTKDMESFSKTETCKFNDDGLAVTDFTGEACEYNASKQLVKYGTCTLTWENGDMVKFAEAPLGSGDSYWYEYEYGEELNPFAGSIIDPTIAYFPVEESLSVIGMMGNGPKHLCKGYSTVSHSVGFEDNVMSYATTYSKDGKGRINKIVTKMFDPTTGKTEDVHHVQVIEITYK